MKNVILDTSSLVRFFTEDSVYEAQQVSNIIKQAESGKLKIILLTQVVFEICYVLKSVYKMNNVHIFDIVSDMLVNDYVVNQDKDTIMRAFNISLDHNIHIIDAVIIVEGLKQNSDVHSFDKKLIRIFKNLKNEI